MHNFYLQYSFAIATRLSSRHSHLIAKYDKKHRDFVHISKK